MRNTFWFKLIWRAAVLPTALLFLGCWATIILAAQARGLYDVTQTWLGARLAIAGVLPLAITLLACLATYLLMSMRRGLLARATSASLVCACAGYLILCFSANPYQNLSYPGSVWANAFKQASAFRTAEVRATVSRAQVLKTLVSKEQVFAQFGEPAMRVSEYAWYPLVDFGGVGWNYRLQFDTDGRVIGRGIHAYD